MIDVHSHILPGIDDGSQSVEESIALLNATSEQGIEYIAATPHFYPRRTDPELFLSDRSEAVSRLKPHLTDKMPKVLLGAEVAYFDGISRNEDVEAFKIEGTELLLLEMPFDKWSDRIVKEVIRLNDRNGIQVMLAHIERYISFQKEEVWNVLRGCGVIMQSNAEFFLSWFSKRRALRMLHGGEIDLLGSDCHNTGKRPQRMGEALEVIGADGVRLIEENIGMYFG